MGEMKKQPKIEIGININAGKINAEQNLYTVETELKITAKTEEKTAFICELTYGALVTLSVPEEHVQPLLLVEIPHLTFPFIRSIVANTTREAGMMPLVLAPIDFAMLYRSRMAKENANEKTSEKDSIN
jgi:preprotein translocase subunit SecB